MATAALLDVAQRGPHPVGVRTEVLTDPSDPARSLATDLWYPALPTTGEPDADHPFGPRHAATIDAVAIDASCPLVVFSHGNGGLRRQSTFLTTHLASWGIAVVAPDHTGNTFFDTLHFKDDDERIAAHKRAREQRPRDALCAIAAALDGRFEPGPTIDGSRIGALGHSFGGWTASKLPALEARIQALCLLAPASEPFVGRAAYAPGELPFDRDVGTLIVAGTDDVLVDLETSVRPLMRRLGAPTALVGIDGADHYHFCDGIPVLHGQHEANPRPNQPRPTRPYDDLLSETRCHRALRGLVTYHLTTALGGEGGATGLGSEALTALDPALREL